MWYKCKCGCCGWGEGNPPLPPRPPPLFFFFFFFVLLLLFFVALTDDAQIATELEERGQGWAEELASGRVQAVLDSGAEGGASAGMEAVEAIEAGVQLVRKRVGECASVVGLDRFGEGGCQSWVSCGVLSVRWWWCW